MPESILSRRIPVGEGVPDTATLAGICQADVFRYALRRLGHLQDAEDVAAETLAAAIQGLSRFRKETEPRLWLLGIARRKVTDALRRRRRTSPIGMASGSSEAFVFQEERASALRRLIDGLPEAQREALLLQTAEELSVAEIARVMGRSASSVNSLLGRAKDNLRERARGTVLEDE